MIDPVKYARQRELEARSMEWGVTRYAHQRERNEAADTKPGQKMVRQMVELCAAVIREETHSKRAGRMTVARKYFKLFSPEQLALVAARAALNAVSKPGGETLVRVGVRIGTILEDAYELRQLEPVQPGLVRAGLNKARKATSTRHRRAVMNTHLKAARERSPEVFDAGPQWTESDKLAVGVRLLEILEDVTRLVAVEQRQSRHRTPKYLVATSRLIEWLDNAHEYQAIMEPFHLPMVIPPVRWEKPIGGGYLSYDLPKLRLMKTHNRGTIDELYGADLSRVYAVLNDVQETPWRVNKAVLDVLEVVSSSGVHDIAGLAHVPSDEELPEKPEDIATNKEAREQWRRAAADFHERRNRARSKRLSLVQTMVVARMMRDEEAIYFPHNLDFRGREYPVVPGLNPQGPDVARALLQFAEGVPIGDEDGPFWLAVHIANLFGVDKVSFEDRVAWVMEHEAEILDSALEPLDGTLFWYTADKPFMALAACMEWAGYKLEGPTFLTRQPIAQDGSCSGLQHFSGMLLDSKGGKAVNLIPGEAPEDFYTEVLEGVNAAIEQTDDPDLRMWMGKVNRLIVKRPAMTYAYSATTVGMRNQILAELKKAPAMCPEGLEPYQAATILAPVVREQIEQVMPRAAEAMEWLKAVAVQMAEHNLPVVWYTDFGLPVVQRSMETKQKRVTVLYDGRKLQLFLAAEIDKVNKRKQAASIAPNFIHGNDAEHWMSVVERQACPSWALVHDSYGVHAPFVSTLREDLRNTFADMYLPDPENVVGGALLPERLVRFAEACYKLCPDIELPPMPRCGDLDIEMVRESDYLFG